MNADIEAFVNSDVLQNAILDSNQMYFPIMKAVSLDNNGTFRLLIGGYCPGCKNEHLRNTCNVMFCTEVLDGILVPRFRKYIKKCIPVYTHDNDLVDIVSRFHGNVSYPFSQDVERPFGVVRKFMLDAHPDIDGYMKSTSSHVDLGEETWNESYMVNCETVFQMKSFMWFIDRNLKIFTSEGTVVEGVNEIADNLNLLMPGFELRTIKSGPMTLRNDRGIPAITITMMTYFETDKYVIIRGI